MIEFIPEASLGPPVCTFALAWQVFEDVPVAAAANRDEAVDRPSEPPGRFRDDPRIVAPRDREAGGTWIGVNEFGVLVAITNRWTAAELAGERSRGQLVADALTCESADEARNSVVGATDEDEYDGFYLVAADADDAVVLAWDGTLSETRFEPGVHVVVNVGRAVDPDVAAIPESHRTSAAGQAENANRVRETLRPDEREGASAWLDRAADVLGDHEYGVCIHEGSYGTRSSSLISLGTRWTYRHADGPPCRTSYEAVDLESHL